MATHTLIGCDAMGYDTARPVPSLIPTPPTHTTALHSALHCTSRRRRRRPPDFTCRRLPPVPPVPPVPASVEPSVARPWPVPSPRLATRCPALPCPATRCAAMDQRLPLPVSATDAPRHPSCPRSISIGSQPAATHEQPLTRQRSRSVWPGWRVDQERSQQDQAQQGLPGTGRGEGRGGEGRVGIRSSDDARVSRLLLLPSSGSKKEQKQFRR